MDLLRYVALLLSFLLACYVLKPKNKPRGNPPPSPPALPVLGHLHLLKVPLHRSLAALSALHGPVLSLRLGSRPALLVSSLSAARDCFSNNDLAFANRPRLAAGKHLGYDYSTLVWASYGPHWRNLRRLTALEFFSTARLNSFSAARREEVKSLIRSLEQDSDSGAKKVVLKPRLFELMLNIMTRMIAGERAGGAAEKFREIVEETFKVSGSSNISDFLPFLGFLGFQGTKKRLMKVQEKRDAFLQELIARHKSRVNGEGRSMLDVLLSLQKTEPEYYTDEIMKGVVLILLTAGTDTSALTIEWAMSLLLDHPEVLDKAQAELDQQVGRDRLVAESDLSSLPLVQSIIQETLRLKPVAPIIPAHESSEDCLVGGFDVPAGTMLLVNSWAIHRDPNLWNEPDKFRPDRWLSESGEGRAGDCRMLPFGLGRRACPGEGLAMRVAGLVLAALIQCLEWRRDSEEPVDLAEGPGLSMPKAVPLEAWCLPRPVVYE